MIDSIVGDGPRDGRVEVSKTDVFSHRRPWRPSPRLSRHPLIGRYVLADDFFMPRRGRGRPPQITDAELVCSAVAQVLFDCPGDRRFLAFARLAPGAAVSVPAQAARLQQARRGAAPIIVRLLNMRCSSRVVRRPGVAVGCNTDPVRAVARDRAPIELPGYAAYGCSRSHSRHYWRFRLMLVCAPDGMPIGFELAAAKVTERKIAAEIPERLPVAGDARSSPTRS